MLKGFGDDSQVIQGVKMIQPKLNFKDAEKAILTRDSMGTMLLNILKNNDNSQNPFDDAYFIKTVIKAIGNLNCFKLLPEITAEIYRQFKLDLI